MIKILKKYKYEIVLGILICIYIAYFTVASFLRYDNFYTGRFDLGNMDQTVWNTINGRIFQMSDNEGDIISRLSIHADFILIFLSPFYLIWSSPKMLLLIQTLILAGGSIFIYQIAKKILKNKIFGLLFSFLFLMYPALQYVNLYDFHAVSFSTTFLLAAFYFLLEKKYKLLILFLILAGLTKEQVWIIVALFGFLLLFQKDKKIKILGLTIFSLSLLLFYRLVSYTIPQSLGAQHFALNYYSDFGDSPSKIITGVLFSPHKIFAIIFEKSRLEYLKQLLMPLGFISFLSPILLVFAIPDLLINLLSKNPQLHQIYYQYSANITTFIFISSIFGVKKIIKWFPRLPIIFIIIYLLCFTFLSAYNIGPLPNTKHPNIAMFTKPQKDKKIIEKILQQIPEESKVAATNNLGSHLSHRKSLSTIPVGIENAEYIAFLLKNDKTQTELVNDLKNNDKYLIYYEKNNFIIFKKKNILL